ncbi:hypothetical protein LCGC14_0902280 [marine sediment metagenome]|uniref:DUF427 domain-containing protein n=1 Tax=marine sediment metagenome TaxID=412755 RepID=A0A0F9S2Y4_9ZZZZ
MQIKTKRGLPIATGYTRIVHGDRGSYIEFTEEQVIQDNIYMPTHAYWRLEPAYADRVFYTEYRSHCGTNAKLYRQKRLVGYADYKVGMWYVSVEDMEKVE